MAHDTKQKILDAAIDHFAEDGFKGTTTRAICERAGVNGAAMNYHWRSKDELWLAACQWAGQSLLAVAVEGFDPAAPLAVTVERVVGNSFDALVADARPIRIINWASLQADGLDFGLTSERFQPIVQFGAAYFEAQVRAGAVADVDYRAVLSTFWGMMLVAFIDRPGHRVFFGTDVGDSAHAARIRASLISSALSILGVRTPG